MQATQSSTKGRQRVPMVRISDVAARHVCFTKRRKGLFKKVCELSTLCGTDSLAFVTSTAGKLYSIGAPDVPTSVERFLHGYCGENAAAAEQPLENKCRNSLVSSDGYERQLLGKLHQAIDELGKKSEELRELRALLLRSLEQKARRLPHGWDEKLGDLPPHELEEMMACLRELLPKIGVNMPEVMFLGEERAALTQWIGAPAYASEIDALMNIVGPALEHYTTPLPLPSRTRAINTSSFAASVPSSALLAPRMLLSPVNFSARCELSTALVHAHPWQPRSMQASALVTPSITANPPMNPFSFCFDQLPAFPPTPNMNASASMLPVRGSGRLPNSWGPSALPLPFDSATSNKQTLMSGFPNGSSAMICSVAHKNPSTSPSSAHLTTFPQTNAGGGTTGRSPPATGYVWPPESVEPPLRVDNNNTTTEGVGGQVINAISEFCATGDALTSSRHPSSEFFDIPRDFDFDRDWTV